MVNGAKTFITNGITPTWSSPRPRPTPIRRHAGIACSSVERGMEGFERGRKLDKVGLHAQDTAELFFDDVRVPVANRLGEEGEGFRYLMREPGAGAAQRSRCRRWPPLAGR